MLELLNGHPDQIKSSLDVSHDIFDGLTQVLVENGFKRSYQGLSVEEQLSTYIPSYLCNRSEYTPCW